MAEHDVERRPATEAELQAMVAAADTGAREPPGWTGRLLFFTAVAWSIFQIWYASPLPFVFGVFILNDTEARSIHLAFAVFLAFTAYPATNRSPRDHVPYLDWALALFGAFCAAYLFLFYKQLAERPGLPTTLDFVAAIGGLIILLEATRRSLGPPLVCVALVFLVYTFAGPFMPEVIQHKGASLTKVVNHQWLTTEGVFGVSLGVSTSFVFLFVLFGSLLEKAGAGNYMMQVSFALLGHLRGGPAKVAVVSSALNGFISGSSISNVVSGGIFTIPMMKRTGLSGIKAGAIETAASVNGQIMPPVMGAAAFLMVEFVGIPYAEIIKHALLPALVSYVALFYIVHLESMKIGAQPLKRDRERTRRERLLALGLGISGTVIVIAAIYYGILAAQALFGEAAAWVIFIAGAVLYVATLWYAARFPDLKMDDPNAPLLHLPETWETVRTGLHFLFPLVVLLWCLMVEQLSPGLSAFWATVAISGILLTQRPIVAAFRGGAEIAAAARQGLDELIDGFALGARNMISIGVATATAGIVVGTVTLTGMSLIMTDFVEYVSGGDVFIMLIMTAVICLFLGMGIPTTANYILIATLMAPVIVELGGQGGLSIPLIAVHLFVFYFGIMADVTPPVGLASYAAAAISGDDPIKTSFQGAVYSLRTGLLPFLFIFNPQLILIGVTNFVELALVVAAATLGMMLFAAATMNYFLTKSRLWESAVLLIVTFTLMRPDFWMNKLYPPFDEVDPRRLIELAGVAPDGARLPIVVEGDNLEGETIRKTVTIRIAGPPGDGRARLVEAGLRIVPGASGPMVGQVQFGSYAKRAGLEPGQQILAVKVPADRPSPYLMFIPALALLGVIVVLQRGRRARVGAPPAAQRVTA
jgi:TRAP transporter 4TM/12TM fusion protein